MTAERLFRIIVGVFILLSLLLGVEGSPLFQHKNWLWFTVFVGVNLVQSGFTNICCLNKVLAKLGFKGASSCGS